MSKWIPVKEKMPEEYPFLSEKMRKLNPNVPKMHSAIVLVSVVFANGDSQTTEGWTEDGKWQTFYDYDVEVIAWMPYPEPYKEGK